ncbi:hypothetical protein Sgleb_52940 [Streptomyces glebosus]|uniref:Uncharacterized protein n=1 Tax=Streptomyces glebosus TaxID=249580 RepID=A0A640T0J3_9ACTN|nr:hypothetical protein Sgleb_52940 [Streptomyces glebosus]GHG79935.1 hypothetical protein GCM10010513_57520 [Streptomyces glebosus]
MVAAARTVWPDSADGVVNADGAARAGAVVSAASTRAATAARPRGTRRGFREAPVPAGPPDAADSPEAPAAPTAAGGKEEEAGEQVEEEEEEEEQEERCRGDLFVMSSTVRRSPASQNAVFHPTQLWFSSGWGGGAGTPSSPSHSGRVRGGRYFATAATAAE